MLRRLFRKRTPIMRGYTKDSGQQGILVFVQCDHCAEKIAVRLRTTSELQRRDEPGSEEGVGEYFVRKTIVGNNCYRRIEATLDFDSRFNLVDAQVTNGKIISAQEYKDEP